MKLEQIYESYYVDPLVAINSSSAAELLEAFEQAAIETSNIGEILASLHEGQIPVNESELTNEQKVFFIGATKVVNAYKESNDPEFKLRFESLINDARVSKGATPPVIPPTASASAAPKKGFLGKLGSFFGNIGRGITAFTRGLVQGFTGSEGKDKTGKDRPGWTSVTVSQDLSKIPERGVVFAPDQLKGIGVDNDTVSKLQNGEIAGVNITDPSNNLISVSLTSGRLLVKRIPTYQAAINTSKTKQNLKSTVPSLKGGGRKKGAPLSQTPNAIKKRQQRKTAAGQQQVIRFPKTPQQKVPESQFQKTTRAVLREFYETNK